MSSPSRTPNFARHSKQDVFVRQLNRLLEPAEEAALVAGPSSPSMPLVFIVGAPRSGTTLMMQWLAASGYFAYPTNLLSRFFGAPAIGAMIQRLLTEPELDYRNELSELRSLGETSWTSSIGKTTGLLEPHEFFYFWRRFFPIDQAQKLTEERLRKCDPSGFAAGWASLEHVFQKPLAAKAILLQYDIERLAEWLPTVVFVYTRRKLHFNVQSILRAREEVHGDKDTWFSVQPPEYDHLKNHDAYSQIAGQVAFTNHHIEKALQHLPDCRHVVVDYELFCDRPARTWDHLQRCLSEFRLQLPSYTGPSAFPCANKVRRSAQEWKCIEDACKQYL